MSAPATTLFDMDIGSLRKRIRAYAAGNGLTDGGADQSSSDLDLLFEALEAGRVRAAVRDEHGQWHAQDWVKVGILAAFRTGRMTDYACGPLTFADLSNLAPRRFARDSGVRVVPGGSAVRRGAYIGKGTVLMPPSYVNVGAYVGDGSMVDSHALVGSCAQIGANVHLSAAAQIGGVLEPPGALPVVIEDGAFIGGGCGVYEGCIVRQDAVLAPGVIVSRSTPVFDLVNERMLRAEGGGPIEIPAGAVVVPGSRPATGSYARSEGVSVYAPVIVKYRDAGTDAATVLEGALREHA